MLEALQNPNYKKIWEKVIMNRHPEAKSLEEAFKIEKSLCEYKVEIAWYGMDSGIPANSALPSLFNKLGAINEKTFFKTDKYGNEGYSYIGGNIFKKSINQYLGNPITLEDILMLFPFYVIQGFNTSQQISINVHYNMGLDECYIKYQLTKPLHEQTPETWEEIANLIDYI